MIEQVLEHYGADLTRVHGDGWRKIKCPFHDDAHASAGVSLGKDAFRCMGCDAKGSAITLVMQQEGIDRNAALDVIERITGEKIKGVRRTAQDDKPRVVSRWRESLFPNSRD